MPLQHPQPYYGPLRPCAPLRYSGPRGFSRSDVSLRIGATGSHVPYKSLIRLRAAYMPDAARAGFRATPELIPGTRRTPGFDTILGISTRHLLRGDQGESRIASPRNAPEPWLGCLTRMLP